MLTGPKCQQRAPSAAPHLLSDAQAPLHAARWLGQDGQLKVGGQGQGGRGGQLLGALQWAAIRLIHGTRQCSPLRSHGQLEPSTRPPTGFLLLVNFYKPHTVHPFYLHGAAAATHGATAAVE